MSGVGSLSELVNYERRNLSGIGAPNQWSEAKFGDQDLDFGEVKGQQHDKRADAADGHNILLFEPISSNKSCWRSYIQAACCMHL